MIKVIIFDLGGPIVEWEGMVAVYKKYENQSNFEKDTLKKLFKKYTNGGNVGDFHSIANFYEKTKPSINMTVEELNAVFDEANAAAWVRPEMILYIEELKKNYKIALLSNFTNGIEIFLRDVFNIYHLFDLVVSSYNVKIKKPDPCIYKHTVEKLNILPEEAVFIDDLEENVKIAKEFGMKGIIFKNVEQCKDDLNRLFYNNVQNVLL